MIPNNQFWFNNKVNGLPPIESGWEYVAEYKNLTPAITERDGNVIFETDGKLRSIGGWNPAKPGTGWGIYDSTNQQWESSDGITWTQIANAPWTARHNFAHGMRADGKFWIWGGDNGAATQKDVWTYDAINGWVQVTSDWGSVAGVRISYSFCVHDDYMYLIGGSIADCVRSNDGINWTKMSDLPAALITNSYSDGYACSHRGYIYVVGGKGNANAGDEKKVFRTKTGATWEQVTDLPSTASNTTSWCRIFSWADRLWYFAGSGSLGNQRGIWMSDDDGTTWKQHYSYFMRARHAQGVNTFGSDLYTVCGNAAPDSNRLYRVAYSTLAAAYVHSLRKVVAGYSGAAIRVRRSSDNTEQDIGFVGNDLDTAALATFVGAGTGYVKTFYNQAGGTNLTQTTQAWQPLIRAGGTTYTQNGKPAIYFDTSSKYLTYGSGQNLTSKYVISIVANVNAGAIRQIGYSTGNYYLLYSDSSSTYHSTTGTYKFQKYASGWNFTRGSQKLIEVYRHRNTGFFYENAVKANMDGDFAGPVSGTRTIFDTDHDVIQIGGESGGNSFIGYLQELNIKTGVVESDSNVAIQSDINGYWGVY